MRISRKSTAFPSIALSAGICLFLSFAPCATAQFVYAPIHYPGSVGTWAEGVSGNEIVGYYTTTTGATAPHFAFMYDGHTYTQLTPPAGYNFMTAFGIDGNTVVGYCTTTSTGGTVSNFSFNGSAYSLFGGPPSSSDSTARAVSGSKVVGYFDGTNDQGANGTHGFTFDGTNYSSVDVPGSTSTQAFGVSGNTILGHCFINGTFEGFDENLGTYTLISAAAATGGTTMWGASQGVIVGSYTSSGNHSFFSTDLGNTLVSLDNASYPSMSAQAISGNTIVGVYLNGSNFNGFEVLIPEPGFTVILPFAVLMLRRRTCGRA